MKNKQVKFVCDCCFKETEYRPESIAPPFSKEHPFKYSEGWVYLNKIKLRLLTFDIEIEDGHFCSQECFYKYLKEYIDILIKKKVIKNLK